MSTSMNAASDLRNAELAECTEPESGVQLNGTTRHGTELVAVRT